MPRELSRSNAHQRDLVLFNEPFDKQKYLGGVRRFDSVTYADCQELYRLNVLGPDEQQNCAPPVKDIVEFLRLHPNFRAHGYAVSPEREDYRVSFEGVKCGPGYSMQDVWDFFDLFQYPDELIIEPDGIYCWFD